MLGASKVLSVGSNGRYYKIKLPDSWKIHQVFNVDLLERYKATDLKKQIIKFEADGEDWVMESIIASELSDDNSRRHVFLVRWKNFTQEDNTWEKYENVVEHDMKLLEDNYELNPTVERDARFKGNKELIRKSNKRKRDCR
jgi:hypothetical protein